MDLKGIGIANGSQLAPLLTEFRAFTLLRAGETVMWGSCCALEQAGTTV